MAQHQGGDGEDQRVTGRKLVNFPPLRHHSQEWAEEAAAHLTLTGRHQAWVFEDIECRDLTKLEIGEN